VKKALAASSRHKGHAGVVVLAVALAQGASSPLSAQHSAFLLDALAGDLVPASSAFNVLSPLDHEFTRWQLQFSRVQQARVDARFNLKRRFHDRSLAYPAAEVFLRAFKHERVLELWVRPHAETTFALLKEYPICALSGKLGPKRHRGDAQVPEGFYEIDLLNPQSDYYLSLHVSYPNRADRARAVRSDLGGDIYIHGGCESVGCLAITDAAIKELYWMAVEAHAVGQDRIPVHIFPARMTQPDVARLAEAFPDRPDLLRFWSSLQPGYEYFERTHRLPEVRTGIDGLYQLADEPAPTGARPVQGSRSVGAGSRASRPGTR
jgi:murein L,D-transpeptidase YafK